MHREKFPEKIPFRLTRMLINAMEVSGIEGNFRITCEHVMRVLRDNKDSVMAVLEAFVYDPLINWRLMANLSPKQDKPIRKQSVVEPGLPLEDVASAKPYSSSRRVLKSESEVPSDDPTKVDVLNSRAVAVINRVSNKLTGW